MGVYTRGGKLWIRFRGADGSDRRAATGYDVGQEVLAREMLEHVRSRVAAETGQAAAAGLTVRALADAWLAKRTTETADDDRGRLDNYILPALGHIPVTELGPRRIREFIDSLKRMRKLGNMRRDGTRTPTDDPLAPRTIWHIYATLRRLLGDAVADEIIRSNPCEIKDGDLPVKRDKNRTWRRTAVFTRDELEMIISAESTPDDRRVLAALMFLGAMRFGEAAALCWRDYDPACEPLGKLVVEKSYSTKKRLVKGVKTENPREMPVHPTLARILASWKLGGFKRFTGRSAKPEDLIVPASRGGPRNVNHMLSRFHEDLERIGLRARRQHDARRTFITIARADGAAPDVLRWATHGPRGGDTMDAYTSLPWASLCVEVSKVRIGLREGKVIEMPQRVAVGAEGVACGPDDHGTAHGTAVESVGKSDTSSGGGRFRRPRRGGRAARATSG